jgi:subtilisin family serine protease|tara:strand:- start:515 stop:4417 length:3903 start_codon:yes stop_codon:yes gene_type:complete
MEIYFSNQVEIIFKKCCFVLVVMFVGSSLGAADIKSNALPQFEGVKAVVLDEGIVIHPKNLLVKFNDLEDIHKFRNLVDGNAIEIEKQYTLVPGLALIKVTHDGIENNDIAAIKDNLTLRKNEIIETKLVEYVEYDYLRELKKTPSDSAYTAGDLWGLHNTGQNRGTVDADIDAPEAWELTTGGEQVIVAVMDSGLHVTHQDLENQLWVNEDEVPNNGKDDDNDGYIDNIHGIAPMTGDGNLIDNVSHGTHVAGTIGASANDSGGHVGVAWNVKLMGIKVGEWWISTAATIDGIEFAADHGVAVANCSFGGYNYSQAEFDAYAAGGEAGIMFSISSGNDGLDVDVQAHYPSSYDLECIISVGASDRNDEQAYFSNYGFRDVDLVAPGVDIYSLSSSSNSSYEFADGTSMASPHVSGVLALMRSVPVQSAWSNLEIREQLLSSVDVLASLEGLVQTSGRLNAFTAVDGMASKVPDGNMEISITPPSGSMLLAGADQEFFVTVIDGEPIKNATVIGIKDDGNDLYFNNDGDAPDVLRKDNIYSYYMKLPEEPRKMKVTILVQAPGKKELIRVVNYRIVPDPVNDYFIDAAKLSGEGSLVEAFNNFATIEPGEPVHSLSISSVRSLWWNWSPSKSGKAIIDISGSDINGLIAVYYGSELDDLKVLSANYPVDGKRDNFAYFDAIQGKTYRIAIASRDASDVGYIRLRAEIGGIVDENPPYLTIENPPNGLVTSEERVEISGTAIDPAPNASGVRDVQVRVNGSFALQAIGSEEWSIPLLLKDGINSIEIIAVDFSNNISNSKVWEIDYKAPDVPNDHFGNASHLNREIFLADGKNNEFSLSQDVNDKDELFVQVNGVILENTDYSLDALSNRKIIANSTPAKGSEINIFYNNWLSEIINTKKATREVNEPYHANNEGGASVWWSFTAPFDGVLSVRTVNTKVDTVLGLYQGSRVVNLALIQSNDDDQLLKNLEGNPGLSRIDQALFKGTTVKIAVDGFGGLKGDVGISSVFTSQEVYSLLIESGENGSLKEPKLPFKNDNGNRFGLYARDSVVEVIAEADEGYEFSGWSGSISSLDNPIRLVITDGTNIEANFSSRSLSDDFESGDLGRLPWLTDKSSGWFVQSKVSLDGDYALQSGEISDGKTSEITVTVDCSNGKGSFYVKLDSEINWDKLAFLIDGRIVEQWSGKVEWNKYEFNLSEGGHKLTWRYQKDFANSVGADSAWVDNIKLPLSLKASVGLVVSDKGHKVRVWGVRGHRYNVQISNDLTTWKPFDSVIIDADGITETEVEIDAKYGAAYFRAVAP